MRNAVLSVVRKITSSRQSPNKSELSAGVDLVPLFDEHPSAVMMMPVALLSQFHLEMRLLSRSSRSRSPSHQMTKLQLLGLRSEMTWPWEFQRWRATSPSPDAHISEPGWRGSM